MTLKEFESQNTKPLTKLDIQQAAQSINGEPAEIEAVSLVEAAGSGFIPDPDNRPKILFEAHSFHIFTKGLYDGNYPNISSPTWNRSLYGASGSYQYNRLSSAISLDREAALKSASWGKYQIMGSNFYDAGYDNVEEFVSDIVENEANHLAAFILFVQNTDIARYLINHDWTHFALRYNGPGQVAYYASKLEDAYNLAVKQGWNS